MPCATRPRPTTSLRQRPPLQLNVAECRRQAPVALPADGRADQRVRTWFVGHPHRGRRTALAQQTVTAAAITNGNSRTGCDGPIPTRSSSPRPTREDPVLVELLSRWRKIPSNPSMSWCIPRSGDRSRSTRRCRSGCLLCVPRQSSRFRVLGVVVAVADLEVAARANPHANASADEVACISPSGPGCVSGAWTLQRGIVCSSSPRADSRGPRSLPAVEVQLEPLLVAHRKIGATHQRLLCVRTIVHRLRRFSRQASTSVPHHSQVRPSTGRLRGYRGPRGPRYDAPPRGPSRGAGVERERLAAVVREVPCE